MHGGSSVLIAGYSPGARLEIVPENISARGSPDSFAEYT
jgi:hypothetical protein